MLRISELSRKTGVSSKTIRYYESVGLLPSPRRATNHYRIYTPADVERLNFIRQARAWGFSLDDIADILNFRNTDEMACDHLQSLIDRQLEAIQTRIRELESLRDELMTTQATSTRASAESNCVCYRIRDDFSSSGSRRKL